MAITIWPRTSSISCWRARPTRPRGSRGISLFIVPKRMVSPAGEIGPANDLRVVSLERKLGIHASPTCVMAYGDKEGRHGLSRRRGEPRPRIHVHHDEHRPALHRHPGSQRRRKRLSGGARLCADPGPGPPARRHQTRHAHHRPSRCPPDGDDDPRQARRGAGARLFHRRGAGPCQAAKPMPRSARRASGWWIC